MDSINSHDSLDLASGNSKTKIMATLLLPKRMTGAYVYASSVSSGSSITIFGQ
jgi:hypothetical protein